jgi:hypothetical protein
MSNAEPYEPGVSEYDQGQHAAWLAALSDDGKLAVYTPAGYIHLMLWASAAKRALQWEMKPGKRLKLLEKLNSLTDNYLTPEMLAIIEPMCDTQVEMMNEARSLDREDDRLGQASFDVLTSWRVFKHFRRLNQSLLAAIKLRQQMTAAGTAPAQSFN